MDLTISASLHVLTRKPEPCRVREHIQERLVGHQQEVCGLKWSPSGNQLASGGNDNLLHIWQSGQARLPALFLTSDQHLELAT